LLTGTWKTALHLEDSKGTGKKQRQENKGGRGGGEGAGRSVKQEKESGQREERGTNHRDRRKDKKSTSDGSCEVLLGQNIKGMETEKGWSSTIDCTRKGKALTAMIELQSP